MLLTKIAVTRLVFVREAIVFLHIPDDPTTVRYHLSIHRLDFQDDDENQFHRTSVAQIFAFVLNLLLLFLHHKACTGK